MNRIFHFDGNIYVLQDGVAMGSPLSPFLANYSMSKLEDDIEISSFGVKFYK